MAVAADGASTGALLSSRLFRNKHLRSLLSLLHPLLTSMEEEVMDSEERAGVSAEKESVPAVELLLPRPLLATDGLTLGWMHMCSLDPKTACRGRYLVLRSSFTTCDSCECVRDAYIMTGCLLEVGDDNNELEVEDKFAASLVPTLLRSVGSAKDCCCINCR